LTAIFIHSSSPFFGVLALDKNGYQKLRELLLLSNRSRGLTDGRPDCPAWKIGSEEIQNEIEQAMAFERHERSWFQKAYLLAVHFEGKFSVSRQAR
jgi:hypothetical protein